MAKYALAWGSRVSLAFARRVIQTGEDFPGLVPSNLMTCMAFETGETFSPSVRNPHSTATGLIQFMEMTAQHYGVTTAILASKSAEDQFDYVWLYFRDAIKAHGPLRTLGDTYMAILNPSAIGKPDDFVMWVSGSSAYAANAGLDANKDHQITKGEAVARVQAKLDKGLEPGNIGYIDVTEPIPVPVKPKEPSFMSLVSSAFRFVFDHVFATAARAAATANPNTAQDGIQAIQNVNMPLDGSPNSTAGLANPIIGKLEDDLNAVVLTFVKSAIDELPAVGGIAQVTGLDQRGADAAKALLVLGEQHALTYLSALFSGHHAAVNAVTELAQPAPAPASPPSSEEAPH